MSATASSTCRPATRWCCAAMSGIVIAEREELLRPARRGQGKAQGHQVQLQGSTTTTSRRPARGATSSACTSPIEERFGTINLGIPYVEFDVPEGTAAGHRPLLPRNPRRASPASKRTARARAAHVSRRAEAGADLPRDRQETAGIRRPSPAGLCRRFRRAARQTGEARPDHRGKRPLPVPLRGHRRPRHRQGACSRSSTRCAA